MPSRFGADDIQAMLEDAGGVALTLGVNSATAIRDDFDETMMETLTVPVSGVQIIFTLQEGSLPGLVIGATVTSEGETFVVKDLRKVEDGALIRAFCKGPL